MVFPAPCVKRCFLEEPLCSSHLVIDRAPLIESTTGVVSLLVFSSLLSHPDAVGDMDVQAR